jgi:cation diffusion facilitator family transporter
MSDISGGDISDTTGRGIRALKISFLGLLGTAALQSVVVLFSGSAGLLADTLHNLADALTSLPLWMAFLLGRRRPTLRFSYGYHRVEDAAGLLILLVILASAAGIGYESFLRLLSPVPLRFPALAMGAAVIGFIGNEAVAQVRIRIGRQIGSAALVADGQHARLDGLASLAALAGIIGAALGYPVADGVAGIVISVAILGVLLESGPEVIHRFMDAIDPGILRAIRDVAMGGEGVRDVYDLRARWRGHHVFAELTVSVDPHLSVAEGHAISEEVRHRLLHEISNLADATIHVDPHSTGREAHHVLTAHHSERAR